MTTYTVFFCTTAEQAKRKFEADTPEQALALARAFEQDQALNCLDDLDFFVGLPVNEIFVCLRNPDSDKLGAWDDLAVWTSDSLRLQRAAPDLLEALEAICDLPADDAGDRTIPAGFLDQARAAIAKAKGGAA